jgi:hypothetical protein
MCDIDLAGTTYTQAVIAPDTDNVAGGHQGTKFSGIFQGNEFTISNLTIDVADIGSGCIGFFGYIANARISETKLKIIINLVEDADRIGGLVGESYGGVFEKCSVVCQVYCEDRLGLTGGICGRSNGDTFTNSFADSIVMGGDSSSSLGCFCGFVYGSVIIRCYASGTVSGADASSWLGGFCGANYAGSMISDSYALGTVYGGNSAYKIGGFCGFNIATISNCYSTASVVTGISAYDYGGFTGNNFASIVNCYFLETTGPDNGHGTPLDNPNMMTQANFSGWDFSNTDGDAADWMMLRENEDYPRLAWQTMYPGDIAGLYGVNMADLMEVVNNWLEQGCPTNCEQADIDNSGTVDLADLSILAANWMKQ